MNRVFFKLKIGDGGVMVRGEVWQVASCRAGDDELVALAALADIAEADTVFINTMRWRRCISSRQWLSSASLGAGSGAARSQIA